MCVEGNIGVGKSTLIQELKLHYEGCEEVGFIDEPVEEWRKMGFLQGMYDGSISKATFQHMVLMSLAGDLLKMLANQPKLRIIITERSPWGNYHTFGKVNLTGTDFNLYEFTWQRLMGGLPAALDVRFIYLVAGHNGLGVAGLVDRMKKRSREEEVASVDVGYLEKLEAAHWRWLANKPKAECLRIDAFQAVESVVEQALDFVPFNGY